MEPDIFACTLEQRLHEQEFGNGKPNMALCLNLHRCSSDFANWNIDQVHIARLHNHHC